MKQLESTLPNMLLSLLGFALFAAAAIGYVHNTTAESIAQVRANVLKAAIAELAGDCANNPLAEEVPDPSGAIVYPVRSSNGAIKAVVVKTSDPGGFGGEIELLTGFDARGALTGYKLLKIAETPGLGMKVGEPKFADQFRGHTDAGKLAIRKDGGTIDAVTGATISSRAVIRAVNKAGEACARILASSTAPAALNASDQAIEKGAL